jgi:copper chaperone
MARTTLNVPDISCEHCEHTILQALEPLEGVEKVAVDVDAKTVDIIFDDQRIDVPQMRQVLEDEDYPVASAS